MVKSKDFGNYHGQRKDLGRWYDLSILGMGNSDILLNGLETKMWKERWFSNNENVVCFSFNLQERNGDKNVGVYSKLRCKWKNKVTKEIPPCEAIEE